MAAVVAVVAVGGGGGLLLDLQSRTVALPEQPIPDPATSPTPAAQALIAQPPAARPPVAQAPEIQAPEIRAPEIRAPGSPVRRSPSSGPAPERSSAPTSPAGQPTANRGEPNTVDLAAWRLTLPTRGDKGGAALVDPLGSVGPWLNRTGNGAFTLWAPSKGATTKNSQHARTELVGRQNFTAGEGPRTLRASVAVTQTPSESQDIILGQIHGAGDIKSVPFVMLHYKAGAIKVVVKKGQSGSDATTYPLLSGVPLGSRFSFTIADAGDGTMVFAATRGSDSRRVSAPIPGAFRGATVRFQAGAYQLGKPRDGADEGGRVTFYGLTDKPTAP